ncbi:MAG: sensor domain-containing diguanylate cyclase, partial [Desulfuromonadaceae bacterium]
IGRSLFFFSPALQPDGQPSQVEIQEKISATLMGIPQSFEGKLCRQDGMPFDVEVSLSLVNVDHEWLIQAIVRDVTERKMLMEELYRLSVLDELTGLYNRRGFLALSEQQLKVAARNRQRLVLFFFDLDHLKKVNDTLGHQNGDAMLVEIAEVLRQTFRKSDIVGRIGGDEFAVLVIDGEPGVQTSIARLSTVLEACNRKEERRYPLSLSLGFALFDPEDPCSLDELIARADDRMYQDKCSKRRPKEDLSGTASR